MQPISTRTRSHASPLAKLHVPWALPPRGSRASRCLLIQASMWLVSNNASYIHNPLNFKGPVGLMDKASASGAGDSRFESWAGHLFGQDPPPSELGRLSCVLSS